MKLLALFSHHFDSLPTSLLPLEYEICWDGWFPRGDGEGGFLQVKWVWLTAHISAPISHMRLFPLISICGDWFPSLAITTLGPSFHYQIYINSLPNIWQAKRHDSDRVLLSCSQELNYCLSHWNFTSSGHSLTFGLSSCNLMAIRR
jgi:hypothetical protein